MTWIWWHRESISTRWTRVITEWSPTKEWDRLAHSNKRVPPARLICKLERRIQHPGPICCTPVVDQLLLHDNYYDWYILCHFKWQVLCVSLLLLTGLNIEFIIKQTLYSDIRHAAHILTYSDSSFVQNCLNSYDFRMRCTQTSFLHLNAERCFP